MKALRPHSTAMAIHEIRQRQGGSGVGFCPLFRRAPEPDTACSRDPQRPAAGVAAGLPSERDGFPGEAHGQAPTKCEHLDSTRMRVCC